MNIETKFSRAKEVSAIQSRQQLQNCALLVAFCATNTEGYYGIAAGSVDGFRNDYAMLHWDAGNYESHAIRAFYLQGNEGEDEIEQLEEICAAIEASGHERPLLTTLTEEEKSAAIEAVREAWAATDDEDLAEWLRELCNCCASDLSSCDWDEVAAKITAQDMAFAKKLLAEAVNGS